MDSNEEVDDGLVVEEMQNWVLDTEEDFNSMAMLEINRSIQARYERALRTGNVNSESESDFDDDEDDEEVEDCSYEEVIEPTDISQEDEKSE